MRISNPFRYSFIEYKPSVQSVYKLHFGKKYLIVKCKALHQSVNQAAKEIDQRIRLGLKGELDLYRKVIQHIKRARVTEMRVEVICQPEDALDLLKCEYEQLALGKQDEENCLNGFPAEIHYPKWIPEETVKTFQKWMADQSKKATAKANRSLKTNKNAKQTKDTKAGNKGTGRGKNGVPVRGRNTGDTGTVQKKSRAK